MSVLIKGIAMPDGAECWNCPCLDGEDGNCNALERIVYAGKRPSDCPLIEIPDHGDLIDESETVEAQYYDDEHEEWSIKTKTVGDVLAEICEVPPKVVIPAERKQR